PITSVEPCTSIPRSSSSPEISTRCEGCARRAFSVGMSVMPPASGFASGFAFRNAPTSASERALTYSNEYMNVSSRVWRWVTYRYPTLPQLPILPACPRRRDGGPDFGRRERHVQMGDAQRLQCVHHRVAQRRQRRGA